MSFLLRLSLLSTLITPALIAASCRGLSEKADVLDSRQESLLLSFEKAKASEKNEPLNSCSLYTRLSGENFPLKELSLLKAHMTCPDPQTYPAISHEMIEKNPWLTGLDLERQLQEAQQKKDPRETAQALLKKAQWSNQVRDKIQWLKRARDILLPLLEKDQALWSDINQRLVHLAPRFIENPEPKDDIRVGSDLIYDRQFAKGRTYLQQALERAGFSNEEKYLAFRALRNSYKTEGDKKSYLKVCEQLTHWLEKNGSPQRLHEAGITWARAQWTEGQPTKALQILKRLEKKLKGSVALEEINYVRARIAEEAHHVDLALRHLDEAQKNLGSRKSSTTDRILFSKAWLLRKKSKYSEAAEVLAVLKKICNQHKDSIEQFTKASRQDLVDQEVAQLRILEAYLPQQMPREELEKLITAVIAETKASSMKDMGMVIKTVTAKTAGAADNRLVSEIVKAKLT